MASTINRANDGKEKNVSDSLSQTTRGSGSVADSHLSFCRLGWDGLGARQEEKEHQSQGARKHPTTGRGLISCQR